MQLSRWSVDSGSSGSESGVVEDMRAPAPTSVDGVVLEMVMYAWEKGRC